MCASSSYMTAFPKSTYIHILAEVFHADRKKLDKLPKKFLVKFFKHHLAVPYRDMTTNVEWFLNKIDKNNGRPLGICPGVPWEEWKDNDYDFTPHMSHKGLLERLYNGQL